MTDSREHLDIVVLKREIERLPSLEAGWAMQDPEDRVAFRAEWHDLIDVFDHLAQAYDTGRLTDSDRAELRGAAALLLGALPLMEQLRLRLPPRAALDRIVAARVA